MITITHRLIKTQDQILLHEKYMPPNILGSYLDGITFIFGFILYMFSRLLKGVNYQLHICLLLQITTFDIFIIEKIINCTPFRKYLAMDLHNS